MAFETAWTTLMTEKANHKQVLRLKKQARLTLVAGSLDYLTSNIDTAIIFPKLDAPIEFRSGVPCFVKPANDGRVTINQGVPFSMNSRSTLEAIPAYQNSFNKGYDTSGLSNHLDWKDHPNTRFIITKGAYISGSAKNIYVLEFENNGIGFELYLSKKSAVNNFVLSSPVISQK